MKKSNNIIIYQSRTGAIELESDFKNQTIWANLNEIADLFNSHKSGVSRHIQNIFTTGEVKRSSTVAKNATVQKLEGNRLVSRDIEYYNLDIILAVGYRINAQRAILFRKWATSVLRSYILDGYAVNEKRILAAKEKFNELQNTVSFLAEKSQKESLKGQETEILNLLKNYSKSLTILDQYDKNTLQIHKGKKSKWVLQYSDAKKIIETIKRELITKKEAGELFGHEREESFAGIIGNIYQTFGGQDLYESIESKAAHLLYFIIKDHPFSDGNKRSASFLFVYFLSKNNILHKETGEKSINDNALTALALLVAESDPKEKSIMINLIINLIA